MTPTKPLLAAAGVALIAGGSYWWYASRPDTAAGAIDRKPSAESIATPASQIEHPVAPATSQEPLPPVAESDDFLRRRLGGLRAQGDDTAANPEVPDFIRTDRLARRFVATADALTREGVPIEMRILKPVPGRLVVAGTEDAPVLDPKNGERYEPYVQWLEKLDTARVASTYREVYPLLQSAYEELGYPNKYFNDRLVAVIDDLLATPDVREPIALAQPHVLYTFADASLEKRSAGQKAMLRLGRDRAARVKMKLIELRQALVADTPVDPKGGAAGR
jgi:hypothetical protein